MSPRSIAVPAAAAALAASVAVGLLASGNGAVGASAAGGPPIARTGAASAVRDSSATVTGTVDPQGAPVDYAFQYGTSPEYGHQVPVPASSAGAEMGAVSESAVLTGLFGATTYHFRIIALGQGTASAGADETFTTAAGSAGPVGSAPIVATGSPSAVGQTAATLNGTVDPAGQASSYVFEYGATGAYGNQTPPSAAGSGQGARPASATITGLAAGETLHYRLVASNPGGTAVGPDATLTTLIPPRVRTGAPSRVGPDGATLTATVQPNGLPATAFFEYGPSTAYGHQTPAATAGAGLDPAPLTADLTALRPGTTLHFRVVAQTRAGTSSGEDATVTTAPASLLHPAGSTAFVAPSGTGGIFVGCVGPAPCHGSLQAVRGKVVLGGRPAFELAGDSGAVVHFGLSALGRVLLRTRHQLGALVTVLGDSGKAQSGAVTLYPFGR